MSSLIFHNGNDNVYKDPLRFIDTLDNYKHIVLYYENQKFGKKIQLRFIRNGLLKGETCIYTTHSDDIAVIENEMINDDIDVKAFNKKGLLKIFKIGVIMDHPDGILKVAREIIDGMISSLKQPFRLVGGMFDELYTEEQIEANLTLEQVFHSNFDKFNGMLLCPYDVSSNPINTRGKWVETILDNHHSAIFVTDTPGEGIAFDMI